MIDEEKGHVFHWKRRDLEPLRACLALVVTVVLLVTLYITLPLPFTKGNTQLKEQRLNDLLNSSGQRSINFLTKSEIARLDSDADFTLYDQFRLRDHFILRTEAKASRELTSMRENWEKERVEYQINYQEVPYSPSYAAEKAPLQADLYNRPLPEMVLEKKRSDSENIRFTLNNSLPKLKEEDLVIPSLPLGENLTTLTVELKVSSSGKVVYAIPLTHHTPNRSLMRWVKSLRFVPSTNASYGSITLSQVVKQD